jgi:hypothetical protein
MGTCRGFAGTCVAIGMWLSLALAGCGSSSKSATTTATSPTAATSAATSGSAVKAATYTINLAHVAGSSGASSASGVAVLNVKSAGGQLCWSISPIKTFTVSTSTTTPTIVTIQPTPSGTPSTPGIPLGKAYEASGCAPVPAAFLGRLQANPKMFYLSVYNTGTGDAVRGQV